MPGALCNERCRARLDCQTTAAPTGGYQAGAGMLINAQCENTQKMWIKTRVVVRTVKRTVYKRKRAGSAHVTSPIRGDPAHLVGRSGTSTATGAQNKPGIPFVAGAGTRSTAGTITATSPFDITRVLTARTMAMCTSRMDDRRRAQQAPDGHTSAECTTSPRTVGATAGGGSRTDDGDADGARDGGASGTVGGTAGGGAGGGGGAVVVGLVVVVGTLSLGLALEKAQLEAMPVLVASPQRTILSSYNWIPARWHTSRGSYRKYIDYTYKDKPTSRTIISYRTEWRLQTTTRTVRFPLVGVVMNLCHKQMACKAGTWLKDGRCLKCAYGKFRTLQMDQNGGCTQCTAGRYERGTKREDDCMDECPAGSYCLVGSNKIACPKGYYCPKGSSDYSSTKCRWILLPSELHRQIWAPEKDRRKAKVQWRIMVPRWILHLERAGS